MPLFRSDKGRWVAGDKGEVVWVQNGKKFERLRKGTWVFARAVGVMLMARSSTGKINPVDSTPVLNQIKDKVLPDEKIKVIVRGKKIEEQINEILSNTPPFSQSFVRRSNSTFYISKNENCQNLLKKVSSLVGGSLEDMKVIPRGWKRACGLHDLPLTIITDIIGRSALDLELIIIDEYKLKLRQRWTGFLSTHLCGLLPPTLHLHIHSYLAQSKGPASKFEVPMLISLASENSPKRNGSDSNYSRPWILDRVKNQGNRACA